MKRLNPETGLPFVHGDERDDGKLFRSYNTTLRQDGTFYEKWYSPEAFAEEKVKANQRRKKKYEGVKRQNPSTGNPFRRGNKNGDGTLVFFEYDQRSPPDENGFFLENWIQAEEYQRRELLRRTSLKKRHEDVDYAVNQRFKSVKRRAKEKGIEFKISANYLLKLYPADGRCPVLGTKMKFLGDKDNSASVDRIDNRKGYIVGNVAWVSNQANTMKSDYSVEELIAMGDWLKKMSLTVRATQVRVSILRIIKLRGLGKSIQRSLASFFTQPVKEQLKLVTLALAVVILTMIIIFLYQQIT